LDSGRVAERGAVGSPTVRACPRSPTSNGIVGVDVPKGRPSVASECGLSCFGLKVVGVFAGAARTGTCPAIQSFRVGQMCFVPREFGHGVSGIAGPILAWPELSSGKDFGPLSELASEPTDWEMPDCDESL
jgi:hypothetical protein